MLVVVSRTFDQVLTFAAGAIDNQSVFGQPQVIPPNTVEAKPIASVTAFGQPTVEKPSVPVIIDASNAVAWPDGSATAVIHLTTTRTNDVIVVCAYMTDETSQPAISSITDTAGLTWAKRTDAKILSSISGALHQFHGTLETWWAYAPTALPDVAITATLAGGMVLRTQGGCLIALAAGRCDQTSPWEPNVSFPATLTGPFSFDSDPPMAINGLSVDSADALLLGFHGALRNAVSSPGNGFVDLQHLKLFNFTSAVEYKQVRSGTDYTVDRTNELSGWCFIADALRSSGIP